MTFSVRILSVMSYSKAYGTQTSQGHIAVYCAQAQLSPLCIAVDLKLLQIFL